MHEDVATTFHMEYQSHVDEQAANVFVTELV